MNNENFGSPIPSGPRRVWSRHYRDQPHQQALTRHVNPNVHNGGLLARYHGQDGNFGLVVPPGLSNAGQSYDPPRFPQMSIIDFESLDIQNRLNGIRTYNETSYYSHVQGDGTVHTTHTLTTHKIPTASPIRSFAFHNLIIINNTGSIFTRLFKKETTGINIPFEIAQDITTRTYDLALDTFVESTQTYTIFSGIAPSNTTGTETVDALGPNGSEHDLEVNTNTGNSEVYLVLRIDLMTSEDKNKLQKYFDHGKKNLQPLSITYSGVHVYNKIVSYSKEGRSRPTYNNKFIDTSYDDPSEFANNYRRPDGKQSFAVNVYSETTSKTVDNVSITRNPAKRPENTGSVPLDLSGSDSGSDSGSGSKAPLEVKIKTKTDIENGYVAVYRVHNLNKDVFINTIFDHSLSGVTPSNAKDVIGRIVSGSSASQEWDIFAGNWKNRSPFSLASSKGLEKEHEFQLSKAKMFLNPTKSGGKTFSSFESLAAQEDFNNIILTPTVTFGEDTDLTNESSFTKPDHDQKHGAPILYEMRPAKLKVTSTITNNGSDGESFETVSSTAFDSFLPGEFVNVWVEPELPPQCPVTLNFNGQRDPRRVEEAISKRKKNPSLTDLTTATIGFDAEFYKRYNSRGQQLEQVVEVFLPRSNTLKDLKLAGLANCPDGADPLTIKYDITIKVYDHNSNFLYETTDTVTQDDIDITHSSANHEAAKDTHTYTSSTNGTLKPVMALEKRSYGNYFNPRRCRFRGRYDGMLSNKFTIPNEHVVVDKNADDDPTVSLTNGRVEVSVSIAYNSGRGGSRNLGMQKIGGSKNGKRIQHFKFNESQSPADNDYQHANATTLLNYSPIPAPKTFIVASSTGNSVTLTWTEESNLTKRKMEFVDQYRLRIFEYPVFNTGFKTVTSGNFIINPKSNRKIEEKIIDYDLNDITKSITLPINSSKGYEFRLEKRSALGTQYRLYNSNKTFSITHEEYSVPFIIQHIPAGAGGTGIRPPDGVTNASPDINNNITDFYIWDASFRGYSWQQGTLNRNLEYGNNSRKGTVQKIKNLEGGVMHVAVNCFADDLKLVLQRSTDNGATWGGLNEFTRFSYEPMPKRVQKPSGFTYSDAQPVSIFQIPHLVGNFNGVPVNIFTDSHLPSGTRFRFQLYSAKLSAAYGTGDGSTPIKLKGSGGSEYTGGWQAEAVTYSPRLANPYPIRRSYNERRDIPSDPTLRENIGISVNWDGTAKGQKIDEYTYTYDAGSTNLIISSSYRGNATRYSASVGFDVEFSGNHPDTQLAAMAVNVNSAKNPIGLLSSAQQLRWSTGVHSAVVFSPTGKMAEDTTYADSFSLATPTQLFINRQLIDASAYHLDNITTNVTFYNNKNGTFRKRYARIAIGIHDELAQALYDLGRTSGTFGFKISDTRLHSRGNPKNKIFSDEDYNTIKSLFSNYGIIVRAVTNGDPSPNDMATVGSSTYRTNLYNIFQHLLEKK